MLKSSNELIERLRTVLVNNKNNTIKRTYGESNKLSYPPLFKQLANDQQQDVLTQLAILPLSTQQALLNEWQARCSTQTIRNPAGYLFGMLKKAQQGAFRATRFARENKQK